MIYTGWLSFDVTKGIVSNVKKTFRTDEEIKKIEAQMKVAQDTMICLIADEMPVLKTDSCNYAIAELTDYISSHTLASKYKNQCEKNAYIALLIEKDGTVSRIRFLKPTEPQCEK